MATANSDKDDSDFDGFTFSDLEDFDENRLDFGSDISVSPVSTPDVSEAEDLDSDDDVDYQQQRPWVDKLSSVKVADFKEECGSKIVLGPLEDEHDFFLKFFPESLVEKLVLETNNYANRLCQEKPDPKWCDTNSDEMRAFLGIFVIFSIMKIPRYSMAWNMTPFFGLPGLASIMPRERFRILHKYFHVNTTWNNPPKGTDGHDKLCHIRPVYDSVLEKCLENYNPPKEQSIGGGQHLPKGSGIKIWKRASPQNGYVSEFRVVVGKPDRRNGFGQRIIADVVKDLTMKIKNKNHHIFMDDDFSSPQLFEDLHRDGIYSCGTVHIGKKGMPAKFRYNIKVPVKQKRGESKMMQKGEMCCVAWKDKKIVHILFNNMDPQEACMEVKQVVSDRRKEVKRPKIFETHRKNRGGVDLADLARNRYRSCRKETKCWKLMFWFLFDIAVCNALVCMKESSNHQLKAKNGNTKKRTLLDFRMNLARKMISSYRGRRKRRIEEIADLGAEFHWPGIFPKRGTCKLCSKEGRRHEVIVGCKQCKKHLCIDKNCFEKYHTKILGMI